MYKLIALGCSLLMGIIVCSAQTKKKNNVPNDKSLLWKVSGKGLKKPSYIFGTLHVICPDDYVWTAAMQKALVKSEVVALEMNMDDPQLQAEMTSGMLLKDGKTLKDFYTDEEYVALSKGAEANGIPLAMMQQFNPFAIISFLYMKAVACNIPASYEVNIMKLAKSGNKEITGLESIDDQLKVIGTLNIDTVAKQVLNITNNLDSFKHTFNYMLSAYKKQDLAALYHFIIESPDYKDDLENLLFARNVKWVPLIAQLTSKKPTFIAVGAGHLWGSRGVLQLLKNEGYAVDPVH